MSHCTPYALAGVLLSSACVSTTAPPLAARPSSIPAEAQEARPNDSGVFEPTAGELPRVPTLHDCLRQAALNDPGLRAAHHDWRAALERIAQARALPDPELSYGYYFESVETFTGSQRHRLRAAQKLPWLRKLVLSGDAAAKTAEATRARFEAAKLALFHRVTAAYGEYYYLGRAIAVTRVHLRLLQGWETLIRSRYRVAASSYSDLITTEIELGKLDDRVRTLEDLVAPTLARLNETMNRPSDAPLDPPTALPPVGAVHEDDRALARLVEQNPELKALDATVAAEERRVTLAKQSYFPDVTLGVEWIDTARRAGSTVPDAGNDPVIGMVSVNLPIWWQRYGAATREAKARRLAASGRRVARERSLTTALRFALYELRDADRKIELYENGLIPKARQALDANLTAYESGTADYLDLLDAERLWLEFELARARALADRLARSAEVRMLTGGDDR